MRSSLIRHCFRLYIVLYCISLVLLNSSLSTTTNLLFLLQTFSFYSKPSLSTPTLLFLLQTFSFYTKPSLSTPNLLFILQTFSLYPKPRSLCSKNSSLHSKPSHWILFLEPASNRPGLCFVVKHFQISFSKQTFKFKFLNLT